MFNRTFSLQRCGVSPVLSQFGEIIWGLASFEERTYVASLDRDVIVWAHWFGSEMSEARRHAVSTWRSSGLNFRLVRAQELGDLTNAWGVKLHPGFDFLTANHKSDYLRSLFMNHEGGVYTDVKPIPRFFKLGLIRFLNSGSFLGGYGEQSGGGAFLSIRI